MYSTIETQKIGRVLVARLSNPPHAFMNEAMVVDLETLVAHADRDPGIGISRSTPDSNVMVRLKDPSLALTEFM